MVKNGPLPPRQKGFTLLELLVVVAIIALLAAILMPVLDRVQEQALKSSCQSNLKQLGLAVAQYVRDYDDTYPAAAFGGTSGAPAGPYWYEVINPYAKEPEVFTCPTAGPITNSNGTFRYSGGYGWNATGTVAVSTTVGQCNGVGATQRIGGGFGYWAGGRWCTPTGTAVRTNVVEEPSATIMIVDPPSNRYTSNGLLANGANNLSYMPVLHGGQVGPFGNASGGGQVTPDPVGGGNYLYADGHVKYGEATTMFRNRLWNIDKSSSNGVQQG